MKNLFDPGVIDEIYQRIDTLPSNATPRWGKMNVAQMLAHCIKPLEMSLGDIPVTKSGFVSKLFGRLIKGVITSPKPYKQSLPTDPSYVTLHTEHDFEERRIELKKMLHRFMMDQNKVPEIPHPFFGKLTKLEWGTSQYKHLDHHLSQFGV